MYVGLRWTVVGTQRTPWFSALKYTGVLGNLILGSFILRAALLIR